MGVGMLRGVLRLFGRGGVWSLVVLRVLCRVCHAKVCCAEIVVQRLFD